MNINITGKHFELTEPIKEYIHKAIETLDKYHLEVISIYVTISADERNGKKGFTVEFVVNLKDKHTFVITQKDKDVYAAIDLATDRLQKSLRRYKDKLKDHKVMSFKDLGEDAEAVSDLDIEEPEIVPMELELHKPLDFDEAIEALRSEKKRQFIVFNDYDGNMRVMYKRKDGRFGLY